MLRLIAITILACGVVAHAQISPDEAKKKLLEKQAARQAERDKVISIKQGDLDDLRAEVAKLKAEIAALKSRPTMVAAPTTGPAAPAFVLKINKGTTRPQLMTFVNQRKDRYRITKDVRSADKSELITLEKYKVEKVVVGQGSNGVDTFDQVRNQKVATDSWNIVLVGEVVTDIVGDSKDTIID
jgi:hypothetical protein